LRRYRVAIRAQLSNETNARQAYLSALKFGSNKLYDQHIKENYLGDWTLGFTRTAAWESTSERLANNQYGSPPTHLDALGGMWRIAITGSPITVYGDLPARARRTYVHGSGGAVLYECWLGWKTDRYSADYGYFVPYWNLRKASTFGADTTGGTTNADATAKDGYKVIVTFATHTELAERVRISVADILAAHRDAMIGEYKILLRAMAYGGLSSLVRVGSGYTSSSDFSKQHLVRINKPYWHLYDLGNVSIPNAGGGAFFDQISNAGLAIEAEKESGGGSSRLYLDGLILIPVTDGMLHIQPAAGIGTTESGVNSAYISINPDGSIEGNITDTTALKDTFIPDSMRWSIPLGNHLLVGAGTPGPAASALTDTFDVLFGFYERWLTLRGADA
jgi:hypothetical protein